MSNQDDRRKEPRKPYYMPIQYVDRDTSYKEYILDISAGGIFIKTHQQLPTGTELTLSIPYPPDSYLTIMGIVVRSSDKGIAVRFNREDLELIDQVRSLVDSIRVLSN